MSERKKARLLLRELNEDEFIARNLVDTRYATRLFASMVRERLLFAGGASADDETILPDDAAKLKREYFERARVRTPQGGVTAMLRGLWGLSKNREESDLHHAIDACVIAAATPQLIKRVNDFHRSRERFIERDGKIISTETGVVVTRDEHDEYLTQRFPEPFATGHFHQEVMARLSPDGRTYRTKRGDVRAFDFANYDEVARDAIRPVFVSRAVKRRRGGEVHKAGIARVHKVDSQTVLTRVALVDLTEKKIEAIVEHAGRNKPLVEALKRRLAIFGHDAKKAFGDPNNPFRKPSAVGKIAPIIRKVAILETQTTGLRVRNGIASLGEMAAVLLYKTTKGYVLVPTYDAGGEQVVGVDVAPNNAVKVACIYKNDYLVIDFDKQRFEGYFVMYESEGPLTLRKHDTPVPDRKYFRRRVTSATAIELKHVDTLGNRYTAIHGNLGDLA